MRPFKAKVPLEQRFWAKVDKGSTDGCWLWTGSKYHHGYGQCRVGGRRGKSIPSHRLAWILTNGPIPDGLNVLHSCDVTSCVRPDHLHLGTQSQNIKDCYARARRQPVALTGEQSQNAKITEADVRIIRDLVDNSTMRQAAIGALFGLSQRQVGRIAHHASWKHVAA